MGDGPGINQGTVLYYLGTAYENLGYRAEALEQYKNALNYQNATFFSNDGPSALPRIKFKIRNLESTP
jgi:tetratricopeptide (TPR) repeat protein